MHTKPHINGVVYSAMALILSAAPLSAFAATDNNSPYKLNAEPVKIPQIVEPSSDLVTNQSPQIYQLEYKYRTQVKPPKVKAELATPAPALLSFKLSDNNNEVALADQPFSDEITRAANAVSLDPSLVHAVIYVESRYRHGAISPKGAVGLMQVLPDTAARYGLREAVHTPKSNIKAGTLYLRDLMLMFDNRLDLVLAAYNAGEGAVKKYSRQIPPYPETRNYVKAVMAKYALNTGANQWHATNSPENVNTQAMPELITKPARASYLVGTDLEITKELFTLSR